ncbi:PIH1 domain-containing protein 2 [Thalassophryne amazonica]|uniref:PIH1 domain-containing protein 2 n=1 Tax=Thalassophryne amazonica TaxID=390379 RepID=UPI001471DB75|nr:PIH1 domain-containing protein 2 [Thalassophryne amazonica]
MSASVVRQLCDFWSMLDDLSENNPEAYNSFIKEQMKGSAERSAPPELHSCLCTEILEPTKGLLYINLCSWERVPAPEDLSKPLPLYGGKKETGKNQGTYTVLDVALNPGVLQQCKDKTEMNELYTLTLSFTQQQHGLTLSHQYTVISCSPSSSPDDLFRRLGFWSMSENIKQHDIVNQTPASLVQQLSSLRMEKQQEDPAVQINFCSVGHRKKDLIQVISSTFVQPQRPEYQLEVRTDNTRAPRSVELTVELPKLCSMSNCQLRISKDDVLLEVEDLYYLLLEFPNPVNEDSASATFNKKTRRLTLNVDVL